MCKLGRNYWRTTSWVWLCRSVHPPYTTDPVNSMTRFGRSPSPSRLFYVLSFGLVTNDSRFYTLQHSQMCRYYYTTHPRQVMETSRDEISSLGPRVTLIRGPAVRTSTVHSSGVHFWVLGDPRLKNEKDNIVTVFLDGSRPVRRVILLRWSSELTVDSSP